MYNFLYIVVIVCFLILGITLFFSTPEQIQNLIPNNEFFKTISQIKDVLASLLMIIVIIACVIIIIDSYSES
jgi:diacylglycerol kinase